MRAPLHPQLHGKIVASGFRPHPLLAGAHAQTMAPALLRPLPPLSLRVERLDTHDGDFIDLGWSGEENEGGPIAVLVHGLTGGFDSKYLRGVARRLNRAGWRSVMVQLRGGGLEVNRVPRFYHHGDTADVRMVWHLLRRREPRVRLATAGWSLGGNIILKALAEEGDAAPVELAVAASVPFRLHECALRLRSGFSRVYQRKLLNDLKAMVRRKAAVMDMPPGVDLAATLASRDFIEFDDAYTAPVNGFADARDYYARCASGQYLHAIRRPTLIVHAADDPFMDPAVVPDESMLSPYVTLELAAHGGHVGFVAAGPKGGLKYWLEDRFAEAFGV